MYGCSGLPRQPGAGQQGGEEVRKENRAIRGKVCGLLPLNAAAAEVAAERRVAIERFEGGGNREGPEGQIAPKTVVSARA
jgi:hypothetical protein